MGRFRFPVFALFGLVLCSCQDTTAQSNPHEEAASQPSTSPVTQPANGEVTAAEIDKAWDFLKATAPEPDPPVTIAVYLALDGSDAEARDLVSSFLRREIRSLQRVRLVESANDAQWILNFDVKALRPAGSEVIYFNSFMLLQRYSGSEAAVKAYCTKPDPVPAEFRDDVRTSLMFIAAQYATLAHLAGVQDHAFLGILHYSEVTLGSELRASVERIVAQLDSTYFEPDVRLARVRVLIAKGLKDLTDAIESINRNSKKRKP